ncbi:MAG: GGDEF domain-containing protein [Burkholderiales bacterium]|nr:GGDEF domain-containing protein [Burkholderiales bacterium]
MFNVFQRGRADAGRAATDALQLAEQTLLAEALLHASAHLIGRPDPLAAARHFCEAMTGTTPNICLAWAWFGDARAPRLSPQVAVGPAIAQAEGPLSIAGDFLTQREDALATPDTNAARIFALAPTSLHGPWRDAANRFGARSALVAPIGVGGDQRGLLGVYATPANYFQPLHVGLMQTVGQLLHATLVATRREAARPADALADPITGLANRHGARKQLDETWLQPSDHESRGVLAFVALDRFRDLNDRFGRLTGDHALRDVAQVLLGQARRSDLVARWGGDCFLMWLPHLATSNAGTTAEKIRVALAALPIPSDQAADERLTASLGVTPAPTHEPLSSVLDRAERALLRAKQSGRNCVIVARADL